MKNFTRTTLADPAATEPLPKSIFTELAHKWKSQTYGEVPINYDDYIQQNPILQRFFNLSACITWIVDVRTLRYTFISSNVKQILGYRPEQFTRKGISFLSQIMHPDDLPQTGKLIKLIWDFLSCLPVTERQKYKISGDYRIIKPDGSYVRVLEQNTILQLDKKGNITHLLGTASDITHWKKNDEIMASIISTEDDTCFFCSPDNDCVKTSALLSKREREIVKLIAEGYNSRLIADKLFISFHTVNTHRQNIIEKTKARNTTSLIQLAIGQGLI